MAVQHCWCAVSTSWRVLYRTCSLMHVSLFKVVALPTLFWNFACTCLQSCRGFPLFLSLSVCLDVFCAKQACHGESVLACKQA